MFVKTKADIHVDAGPVLHHMTQTTLETIKNKVTNIINVIICPGKNKTCIKVIGVKNRVSI